MSFAARKFLSLLFSGVICSAVWFLSETTTVALTGNLLGESALAGLSLVEPFTAALFFMVEWIAFGSVILFSRNMGQSSERRARDVFTVGFMMVLAIGLTFALVPAFFADEYLKIFAVGGEAAEYALTYLKWYTPAPVLVAMLTFLVQMVSEEGDVIRSTSAGITYLIANLLFTLLGYKLGFGIAAAAVAGELALLAAIVVLSTHFFSPSNTLGFVRPSTWLDLKAIPAASFGDSSQKLAKVLLVMFLTKLVVAHFGGEMLPVLQVVITLWGINEFLDGISSAITPLVSTYHAEKNPAGVRRVMDFATKVSLFAALILTALLFAFPTLLTGLLGVTDPKLVASASTAIRLIAPTLVILSLSTLFSAYFSCIEHSGYSLYISMMIYLICPIAAVALIACCSASVMWLGLFLGPLFAFALLVVLIVSRYGRDAFPLLLNREIELRTTSFSLRLTDEAVVEASRKIGEKLSGTMGARASLLVEEVLLAVRDRNAPKRVLAEVSLIEGECPRLICRDDGVIFDITDTDQRVSSLRSFVVANLMEREAGRENLVMTGFNRNVFRLACA